MALNHERERERERERAWHELWTKQKNLAIERGENPFEHMAIERVHLYLLALDTQMKDIWKTRKNSIRRYDNYQTIRIQRAAEEHEVHNCSQKFHSISMNKKTNN